MRRMLRQNRSGKCGADISPLQSPGYAILIADNAQDITTHGVWSATTGHGTWKVVSPADSTRQYASETDVVIASVRCRVELTVHRRRTSSAVAVTGWDEQEDEHRNRGALIVLINPSPGIRRYTQNRQIEHPHFGTTADSPVSNARCMYTVL